MLRAVGLRTHSWNNRLRSLALVAGIPFVLPVFVFLLFAILGGAFGSDSTGAAAAAAAMTTLMVVGAVTLVWLPFGYLYNQRLIDWATDARLADDGIVGEASALLEELCISCGMAAPSLRIIETDAVNAFASGLRPGHYSITVTRGLLSMMTRPELRAVLAHELTHIRNQDVRLLVIGTLLVGVVPMTHGIIVKGYWFLLMGILGIYRAIFSALPVPLMKEMLTITYGGAYIVGAAGAHVIGGAGHLSSLLMSLAVSRRREFMADAGAVELTKDPDAMISALLKVDGQPELATRIDGVKQMLFHYSPSSVIDRMLSTHPPISTRVEALVKYAGGRLDGFAPKSVPLRGDGLAPHSGGASAGETAVAGSASSASRSGRPFRDDSVEGGERPTSEDPELTARYRRILETALSRVGEAASWADRTTVYDAAREVLRRRTPAWAAVLRPEESAEADRHQRAFAGAVREIEAELADPALGD